ncbi:hypothetical protein ABEB36_000082 [Hypothenemus hampei]|uniref:Uncharacterized protein n=1 Tax=Hypothenemus hampei TaxID=57062 RepID=A0ABD1FA79_HYPHA
MNEVKSDNTIDHLKSADIMKMDIELEDGIIISEVNNKIKEIISPDVNKNVISTGEIEEKEEKISKKTGEEYIDIKENVHQKRLIKFGCTSQSCKYKCNEKINEDQRLQIHKAFWKLSDTKKNQVNMSKRVLLLDFDEILQKHLFSLEKYEYDFNKCRWTPIFKL